MLDYLKLGRNLYRFAPRVKAKTTTFLYNGKGISQFKKKSPEIEEAFNNTFRGTIAPMLELSFKDAKHRIGEIVIKDRNEELSRDNFVLLNNYSIKDFLPETDGYMQKLEFDKNGIIRISQQNEQLKKIIPEFIKDLKNPKLELTIGNKKDYSICKILLKEDDKVVNKGFYSKSKNNKTLGEKIHFFNDKKIITGFGDIRYSFIKQFERLNKELEKRLWLLDKRTKIMVKSRYGIDCSPQNISTIADEWGLTSARIRGIISDAKKKMLEANTYSPELKEDLDNLDYILSDKERYALYYRGSESDIKEAKDKIRKYWKNIIKF